MLDLAPIDRELLDGVHGAAAARAMALLVRYGEASSAREFISIGSAHIDGCLYHGPSSIDFVRRFVDLGGRVRVPTTLNVAAIDVTQPGLYGTGQAIVAAQTELTQLHEDLGCLATLTCAPYQRLIRPQVGEHVAWAESNAIVFANSVLGARTDRYGDFADLCAALTGRVPRCGLHLDENRRPTMVVALPALDQTDLPRELYFAAAGYVAGRLAAGGVPFLTGLPDDGREHELKALGAAGASSGALGLFHAERLTPEAETARNDCRPDTPRAKVTAAQLAQVLDNLCPLKPGEPIAAMCLGTPHYSLSEFAILADQLKGRTRSAGVDVYVSTSREIAAHINRDPAFEPLRAFGVDIIVDTCTYVTAVRLQDRGAIVTDSAKYAHYGPGNLNRRIGLMSLARCIRSVELGTVAPC